MSGHDRPVDTIDDVLARLDEIVARAEEEEDPIGYFAALYRRITRAVRDAVKSGYFEDPERMKRLDVVFARRYFAAYDAWRAGEIPSAPWRVAFEATARRELLVMQHLLLGVNAHVDLDLGIAAAEVQRGADIEDLRTDFFRLNALLARETDAVRHELEQISFLLRWFDLFGRLQDDLVSLAVDWGRDHAWHFAETLSGATGDGGIRDEDDDSRRTTELGRRIVWPGWILGVVLRVVRWTERGSVSRKIAILAAPGS